MWEGPALEAIRNCQLMGGADGYKEARSILEARFGNTYLVTERIVKDLKSGKSVRSHEIQKLADDLTNASLVLNQIGTIEDAVLESHHFSDASSRAYGCCTNIRCVNKDGSVHVQLVTSRSRVAPIKVCKIPRLELQAAVLSVKMDILLR